MEERTPPHEENDEPRDESGEAAEGSEQPRDESDDATDASNETREQSREHRSETSEPAAPSIGSKTKIDHVPPAEREVGKDASDTDAMGRDKRREVIGESYGPSRSRVILSFVAFFAIVGIVFVGLMLLVGQVDKAPDSNPALAPWSAADVEQQPPQDLDTRQPVGAEGQPDSQ